jgi:hypothetical protein
MKRKSKLITRYYEILKKNKVINNFKRLGLYFETIKVTYKKYMTNKEYSTTLKEELITKRKFKVIPLHK